MAPAAAMLPAVAAPEAHNSSAPPTSSTGSAPPTSISVRRKPAAREPNSVLRSRKPRMAPSATLSSCEARANSFTVLMLVMVSTTCPETAARALARAAERSLTLGMNQRITAR